MNYFGEVYEIHIWWEPKFDGNPTFESKVIGFSFTIKNEYLRVGSKNIAFRKIKNKKFLLDKNISTVKAFIHSILFSEVKDMRIFILWATRKK